MSQDPQRVIAAHGCGKDQWFALHILYEWQDHGHAGLKVGFDQTYGLHGWLPMVVTLSVLNQYWYRWYGRIIFTRPLGSGQVFLGCERVVQMMIGAGKIF